MKKITLIACAALVAGLLVSCNNGAKDYNNVTTTSTYHSYTVKGTYTVVEENAYEGKNSKDEVNYGEEYKYTTIYTLDSGAADVQFWTDEQRDYNYDNCKIQFSQLMAFNEKDVEGKGWNWSEEKYVEFDAAEKTSRGKHDKADDPSSVSFDDFWMEEIDGVWYYNNNGKMFEVTVDADKFKEGESFTLKVTVDTPSSGNSTYKDGKDKTTGTSTNSSNTTRTWDLTFTAK